MKTIFILMDSLNRHYLSAYGNPWVKTPNIDRLAARGVTFENHYVASAPCMPARRDLMTGRYTFLETPWGPLEPYDDILPRALQQTSATYTHMITDHYHYWQWNGLGYNCFFDSWEFIRGQEGDNEIARVKDPHIPPTRGKGANRRQHWVNRAEFDWNNDLAYPTPQCFARAVDFLDHNHDADNWMLHLEVFDPHEPFEAPQKYRDLYNDRWPGRYHYDWPHYARLDPEHDDADALDHIRKSYAASLTMADAWLGKLLDRMDALDLWRDTTLILTTDHGHLLGEHGYWAKNYMFDYRELMHIPLIVCRPGAPAGARRSALSSAIDLNPTIREIQGAAPGLHVQGQSLLPLLAQDGPHHDAVLYGYFGKDIGLTDGRYTYCRQPQAGSITHCHTAMPVCAVNHADQIGFDNYEMGRFLKHTAMPVYRIPRPSNRHQDAPDYNPVFDLQCDPRQMQTLHDAALESRLESKMSDLLRRYDAPACQFERTGLESR
ncbi:MAG: sulfatase [Kiritimatiellia bacterium]